MKKPLFRSLILALCLLLFCGTGVPAALAADGDEIRASKKIISVVYDDSGSMLGERWSYTNYAMQALIALLNEQDELYITFMSEHSKATAIDTSDLAGAVKSIHDLHNCGGTYEEALDTARRKLGSVSEKDTSTQFWMVILTDGSIPMNMSLQDKLNTYKNNKMSNGSMLNVVYLGMGDASAAKDDPAHNLHSFTANSDDEIVDTLRQTANMVSGRLSPDSVTQVDKRTISVTSKLPLYSISILSQKSDASVIKASTVEEKLNVQRNIKLDATDIKDLGAPMPTLYGNAAVINKKDGKGKSNVIPADTYVFTFSSDVDVKNLTVQVEPAIAIKMEVSKGGKAVKDFSKIAVGDKVDIRVVPVVPGTDTVINSKDLPKKISWKIEYEVDGKLTDSVNGTSLKGVTLKNGANTVRGIMTIPGYAPSVYEIPFTVEPPRVLGIDVIQPDDISYKRCDLASLKGGKGLGLDDSNTVKFLITDKGKPLSKEELQACNATLVIDSISVTPFSKGGLFKGNSGTAVSCRLEQNGDGSYSLIPENSALTPAALIKTGKYTVTVSLAQDGKVTANGEFSVVASSADTADTVIRVIVLLIIIYLAYLFFIKHKFHGQVVHYECWRIGEDGTGVLQKGQSSSETLGFFSGHFLLPARACFRSYRGLTLVAGPDKTVTITGKSIANSVEKFGRSSSPPEKKLEQIEAHLIKTLKKTGKKEASDQELTKIPIYFKSGGASKSVWRIWMTED